MIELAQAALDHFGIDDTVEAVGQFAPRGQSGAMFAGGMVGGDVGGAAGDLAGGLGLGAGMAAGRAASSASSGLPPTVMVAASASTVYGMHARTRRREPDSILFAVPRAGLTVKVHQRVNVRVLELIDEQTGCPHRARGQPPPRHPLEGRDPRAHGHPRRPG